jgi:hypothetical protein
MPKAEPEYSACKLRRRHRSVCTFLKRTVDLQYRAGGDGLVTFKPGVEVIAHSHYTGEGRYLIMDKGEPVLADVARLSKGQVHVAIAPSRYYQPMPLDAFDDIVLAWVPQKSAATRIAEREAKRVLKNIATKIAREQDDDDEDEW